MTVPCHGASAFPGGSRLPHGTVPVCSKHRTGTVRHSHYGDHIHLFTPFPGGMRWVSPFPLTRRTQSYSLKASFLKILKKFFSRRACPRKTAKSAQQVAMDLLGAEMFYKDDCLHCIVHIQSRMTPTEGLRFFLTGADHGYCEIKRRTRQNNLQSATVSLQVVIGLCKRKETAALKIKAAAS